MYKKISYQTFKRLPIYLQYVKGLPPEASLHVSATQVAKALNLNDVQVRKDLASVSENGKPKVGYPVSALIVDLEEALGFNNRDDAVVVGAGKLGQALLCYSGFANYGFHIVAGFDLSTDVIGSTIGGKQIFSMEKLENLCTRMKIQIGIIAVPADQAQIVCDAMLASGIRAVWNFAPVHLEAPDGVLVHNADIAASLAVLTNYISKAHEFAL